MARRPSSSDRGVIYQQHTLSGGQELGYNLSELSSNGESGEDKLNADQGDA